MSGYKQMLRDRMSNTMLDLALRYCKAKNRWIDYVYETIVKKYPISQRSVIVKQILGIKPYFKRIEIYDHFRYVRFDRIITKEQVNAIPKSALYLKFIDTIDFDTLIKEDPNMYTYWINIAEWVDWFSKNHMYIQDSYEYMVNKQTPYKDIVTYLMNTYGTDIKLTEFLIKSFQ